jgi:hypothetical protein
MSGELNCYELSKSTGLVSLMTPPDFPNEVGRDEWE